MLLLNSTREDDIVASYKHKKGEEIYLKDANGNIKEISELASTNIYAKNVLNLKEDINGLLVIVPILTEKHEENVLSIKEAVKEFNKINIKEKQIL